MEPLLAIDCKVTFVALEKSLVKHNLFKMGLHALIMFDYKTGLGWDYGNLVCEHLGCSQQTTAACGERFMPLIWSLLKHWNNKLPEVLVYHEQGEHRY